MIKTIGTHIKVKDFEKSLKFYEGLGFEKIFEYGPNKEVKEDYSGATFACGVAKLEIANGHRAVNPEVFNETVLSSKISLMIEVDSIVEIIKKAKEIGLLPTTPVRHYYWGKLEVVFRDPDGVILVFTETYTPEMAKKLGASEEFGKSPIMKE